MNERCRTPTSVTWDARSSFKSIGCGGLHADVVSDILPDPSIDILVSGATHGGRTRGLCLWPAVTQVRLGECILVSLQYLDPHQRRPFSVAWQTRQRDAADELFCSSETRSVTRVHRQSACSISAVSACCHCLQAPHRMGRPARGSP